MKVIAFTSILFVLYFMGCSYEESKWDEAKKTNSITSFEKYISEYPNGKYINNAKESIEEINWLELNKNISIEKIQNYKGKYPKSKHLKEIASMVEKIEYDSLVILNNISSLKDWKKNHPEGTYNQKIDSLINELLRPTGKENVSIFVSEDDYAGGQFMAYRYDDKGPYYSMPNGMTLIVNVTRGKIKNTMKLKAGMTKETILELAYKNDIYIEKKKWIVNGASELVFSNNRLVGTR